MDNIRKEVETYLKSDRTLAAGRDLYNKLPGKGLAMQRYISRMTGSEKDLQVLYYELSKACGISERSMNILLAGKPQKETEMGVVDPVDVEPVDPPTVEDRLMAVNIDTIKYRDAIALLKELEIKPKSRKGPDVIIAVSDARANLVSTKIAELPTEVKASIKMREQFPFLKEKECPDALKILVNDLISSREAFVENQPKLHGLLNEAEEKHLVDTVLEDYITNKEAWDELEHYKETGEILGKHPIFAMIRDKDEISALNTVDLAKKIKNLKINIGKNKNKGNQELVDRDEVLLAHAVSVLEKR